MQKIWTSKNYKSSNLYQFESFLSKKFNISFSEYDDLHKLSIKYVENFWESIAEFYKIDFYKDYNYVLKKDIPFYKSKWFGGAELSYSKHI